MTTESCRENSGMSSAVSRKRRRSMLVAEILNRDVPTVGPDDDVFFAVRRLQESRGGILPVVVGEARGARIVGVLRYRDVFTATYGRHDATTATPVGAAMSPAGFT